MHCFLLWDWYCSTKCGLFQSGELVLQCNATKCGLVLRRTVSENWNWYCTAGRSFETFAEQQLGPVTDAQVCKDQEEDGSYDDHDEDGRDDEVDMAMITYLASKLSAVFYCPVMQVVWMLGGRGPPVHRRHQIVISSMFPTIESPSPSSSSGIVIIINTKRSAGFLNS